VAVFAAARSDRREERVKRTGQNAAAIATVVNRVFAENLRKRVPGRVRNDFDSVVRRHTLAVTLCALAPFGRGVPGLVDAAGQRGGGERPRPIGVEQVVVKLDSAARTVVRAGRLAGLYMRRSLRRGRRGVDAPEPLAD
jgi:hypothetical protein